jgi:hypothetical protein
MVGKATAMTDDVNTNEIEQQLLRAVPGRAPAEMRSVILGSMQSKLRSTRWDRRLARTAAVLVCLAVGLNGTAGWRAHREYQLAELQRPTPRAITETAEMIASVTDKETGQWFEERMVALRASRSRTNAHVTMQRVVNEILKTWDLPEKDG